MSIFTEDAILRKLSELRRASATLMANHTGYSVSTCSRYLKSLARQGRVGSFTKNYRQGIDAVIYVHMGEKSDG